MPALGMAQETGRLVRWLKRDGDAVEKGEPLMEVETDKATVEIEAPASGTLSSIAAAEGDDVAVGRQIALILDPGETAPEQKARAPRVAASPRARRLAAEKGVELGALAGSGPAGAVVEDDLLQAGPIAAPAEGALWRAMADNVTRSWREAPHFFVIREVDASALIRNRARESAEVTYTDLLVKAVAGALAKHPRMNGLHDEVNIGLAVAVADGLLVPVIHEADRLSVGEIAARRRELLQGVTQGKIRASDLGAGTFTLSNLGMYGVDVFTAILTEGQAGILAVGRIAERVIAEQGQVRVRPTMLMSLSCDHRRIDGARAAEFLQTLVAALEDR